MVIYSFGYTTDRAGGDSARNDLGSCAFPFPWAVDLVLRPVSIFCGLAYAAVKNCLYKITDTCSPRKGGISKSRPSPYLVDSTSLDILFVMIIWRHF